MMKRMIPLLLVWTVWALPAFAGEACEKPWLFFDLGLNTLVDTSKEDANHELIDMYYMPGAQEYLATLEKLGYRLGLLVDVPEDWGSTDEAAFAETKRYIAKGWIARDSEHPLEMDWSVFTPGAAFFPPKNEFRKANNSLYLFRKAVAAAAPCKTIYQATKKKEINLAKLAGMKGYQVGVSGQPYYLPIDQIENFSK